MNQQKDTIASLLQQCLSQNADLIEVDSFPSQVLCIRNQVQFTERVEEMMPEGRLSELRNGLISVCQRLSSFKVSMDAHVSGLKIKALVLDMIHQRDVVDELIKDGRRNTSAWVWNRQLRYYAATARQDCCVQICTAEYDYAFEYQGNQVSKVDPDAFAFLKTAKVVFY